MGAVCTLAIARGGIWDPSRPSWLGSTEQPLLGEILLLFSRCYKWLQHHGIYGSSHPSSIPWDQQEPEAMFWLCPGGNKMVC